jgi:hypothetical protein
MNKIILLLSFFLLSSCDQQFRYACQDHENWDKDICKKPICEINRECPEYIFGKEEYKDMLKKEKSYDRRN